jgi:hypothetical protein
MRPANGRWSDARHQQNIGKAATKAALARRGTLTSMLAFNSYFSADVLAFARDALAPLRPRSVAAQAAAAEDPRAALDRSLVAARVLGERSRRRVVATTPAALDEIQWRRLQGCAASSIAGSDRARIVATAPAPANCDAAPATRS